MKSAFTGATIPNGRMFRYDPATGQHEQFYEGGVVGEFTIQDDGTLLLFMARGAIQIYDNGNLTAVVEGSRGKGIEVQRCNRRPGRSCLLRDDAQPQPPRSTLPAGYGWVLDRNRGRDRMLQRDGITPDRSKMYYTDSTARKIYLFDYDEASGDLTNQRVFLDVGAEEGIPDGMTVDAEGYVWSARWDGNCVVRYNPDAQEVSRIQFPARKVSCITLLR